MKSPEKIELISFKLCPYVQRSVILLNEKGLDYEITYIDLRNKPDWFLAISPMGKVPVLKVDGTVLFESAVIAEYLDETHPPSLHPSDPLKKAHNRAWAEFSSELLMLQFRMLYSKSREESEENKEILKKRMAYLEREKPEGDFFNGDDFALVDAAFAPFFMRMKLAEDFLHVGFLEGLEGLRRWSAALLSRPSVRESVVPEFSELFRKRLEDSGALGKGSGT